MSSYVKHELRPGTLLWHNYHYKPTVAMVLGPCKDDVGFIRLVIQKTGKIKMINKNWIPKKSIIYESR